MRRTKKDVAAKTLHPRELMRDSTFCNSALNSKCNKFSNVETSSCFIITNHPLPRNFIPTVSSIFGPRSTMSLAIARWFLALLRTPGAMLSGVRSSQEDHRDASKALGAVRKALFSDPTAFRNALQAHRNPLANFCTAPSIHGSSISRCCSALQRTGRILRLRPRQWMT